MFQHFVSTKKSYLESSKDIEDARYFCRDDDEVVSSLVRSKSRDDARAAVEMSCDCE